MTGVNPVRVSQYGHLAKWRCRQTPGTRLALTMLGRRRLGDGFGKRPKRSSHCEARFPAKRAWERKSRVESTLGADVARVEITLAGELGNLRGQVTRLDRKVDANFDALNAKLDALFVGGARERIGPLRRRRRLRRRDAGHNLRPLSRREAGSNICHLAACVHGVANLRGRHCSQCGPSSARACRSARVARGAGSVEYRLARKARVEGLGVDKCGSGQRRREEHSGRAKRRWQIRSPPVRLFHLPTLGRTNFVEPKYTRISH